MKGPAPTRPDAPRFAARLARAQRKLLRFKACSPHFEPWRSRRADEAFGRSAHVLNGVSPPVYASLEYEARFGRACGMFHDLVAEARAQKYGYRLVTLLRCLRLLLARFEETRLDNGGCPPSSPTLSSRLLATHLQLSLSFAAAMKASALVSYDDVPTITMVLPSGFGSTILHCLVVGSWAT